MNNMISPDKQQAKYWRLKRSNWW